MTALRHFETPLLKTPFHPRTEAANKLWSWGNWGGYTTALTFDDLAMEHSAIRNTASVYDLCPMIKYRIEGPDAADYLNRLTVRNAAKLSVGGGALHGLDQRSGPYPGRWHALPAGP